jgi:N-acetylmuramoyl-L-alanine amidase
MKNIFKKLLILSLMIAFNCLSAEALEIIYPKQNHVTINAKSTFFIGSTKPTDTLTINGNPVKVNCDGSFTYVVPLSEGDNIFKITSTPKTAPVIRDEALTTEMMDSMQAQSLDFVITKPEASQNQVAKTIPLIVYPVAAQYKVKRDGAPLRTVPVDWGITRLSHLPCGMQLLINGEKGDFYRVVLGTKTTAWIMKSDVEKVSDTNNLPPAQIKLFKHWENPEYNYYMFYLDRKTPYALKEENGLKLRLYNVELTPKAGAFIISDNVLTYNIPIKQKLFGYQPYFSGENLVIKVRKYPTINIQKPLTNVKILVDAGHGGSEFGAIGALGGKEKDITLAIAQDLKQELLERGATVVMTRENDCPVSLADRVKLAETTDSAISVSIHANAIPDGGDPAKSTGTAVYYYHNQARALSNAILTSITTEMGLKNNGDNQASFALVRGTSAVSVLVETAYIINPADYALLTDVKVQHYFAKAIADGIERYMSGETIRLR